MTPKGAVAACCLLFACFFSDVLSAVQAEETRWGRRNFLLDVDTGVDDAMAITLAASSPNVCVLAITVVAGNTNLSNAYNNTLRVLEAINRTDIPVYKGADRPIDGLWNYEEVYFGPDNFGNASSLYPMGNNSAPDPDTYGYLKMMEIIKNNSGDLTLVLLGPLTNLAIALLVEPNLTENVTAIYILGGNICGRGNILPGSEFNFLTDPEAALVVLQRAQCPVYIIPWETVLKSTVPWATYYSITNRTEPSPLQKFLRDITNYTVNCCMEKSTGFNLGDYLAVLAAIDNSSITDTVVNRVSVELTGTHTRGQLVHGWLDYMIPEVKRNATIITGFNASITEEYFNRTFNQGSQEFETSKLCCVR
ncbi:nucleoside hydrolase-like [Amblyomma americanum]